MLLLPLLYGWDDWGLPEVRQNKDFFILYFRNKDFSLVVWLSTLCSHPPPSLKTKKGENPKNKKRVFLLVPLNLWGWRPLCGRLGCWRLRQNPAGSQHHLGSEPGYPENVTLLRYCWLSPFRSLRLRNSYPVWIWSEHRAKSEGREEGQVAVTARFPPEAHGVSPISKHRLDFFQNSVLVTFPNKILSMFSFNHHTFSG